MSNARLQKTFARFFDSRSKIKPVTNKTLQIAALNPARNFVIESFKTSSTWLILFEESDLIKSRMICGEENFGRRDCYLEECCDLFDSFAPFTQETYIMKT